MVPALWPMSPCVQTVIDVKQDPLIPLEIYDFPVAASAVSIAYEFLCLTLTVVKTVGAYRVQRKMGMETTLSGLLLRDGSLYFAVLTALGIFSVVAASIPESILPVDIGVIFGRAFVPVLTTRFIVNLHQTGRHSSRVDTGTLSLWSFHVAQENGAVSTVGLSSPSTVITLGPVNLKTPIGYLNQHPLHSCPLHCDVGSMSSDDTSLSQWIPVLEDTEFLDGQANAIKTVLASTALLYYDFILTLPDEIRLAWRAPRRLATVFFLLVRYLALVNMSLGAIIETPENSMSPFILTDRSCQVLVKAALTTHILLSAAVSAFIAARIMALWSRNWYLGAVLFLAGLVNWSPFVEYELVGFLVTSAPWPLHPCLAKTMQPVSVELVSVYIPAALSAVNLVYETTCLVLTIIKTIGLHRTLSGLGQKTYLTHLLLRDGSLYFGVMTILGVLNILNATVDDFDIGSALSEAFSRSLVPMLTCRFIANLRDVSSLQEPTSAGEHNPASTVQFNPASTRLFDSVAGPLGLVENESMDDGSGEWPEVPSEPQRQS